MLQAARNACEAVPRAGGVVNVDNNQGNKFGVPLSYKPYPLIQTNGDAELWEQLLHHQ